MEAAAGPAKESGSATGPSSEQARPNNTKSRNRSAKKQKAAEGGGVSSSGGPQGAKGGPPAAAQKGGKAAVPNVKVATTNAAGAGPEAGGSSSNAKRKRRKKEAAKQANKRETGSNTNRDGSGGAAEDPVGKPKLKVVVRRLPPNVPEAVFWKAVSPWVALKRTSTTKGEECSSATAADDAKANVDYAYFVHGKLKHEEQRGANVESGVSPHVFSRAYMRFTSTEALVAFHRAFDGHLFRDSKGNEYNAVVEFAPFQRTAGEISKRKKADPRQGTVEEDPDYQAFVASLEQKKETTEGQSQSEKTDAQLMSHLSSSQAQSTSNTERAKHTPLLDHLRAQHSARAGSAALKNARSYLNRSNNAYAAASTTNKATASSKDKKGKAKVKGQAKGQPAAAATADPLIPTGPKASRKGEGKGKGQVQQQQQQQQQQPAADGTPRGPKGKSKTPGGGGGGGGGSKAQALSSVSQPDSRAAVTPVALLTKQGGPTPTEPSADRPGAGRGRGRRADRGRGTGRAPGKGGDA